MSRARKSEKPESDDSEDEETSKPVPWAVEVEFYNKPSFMSSVQEIKLDGEHVSLVRDDGALMAFPFEAVRKVLVMHTTRRKGDLD